MNDTVNNSKVLATAQNVTLNFQQFAAQTDKTVAIDNVDGKCGVAYCFNGNMKTSAASEKYVNHVYGPCFGFWACPGNCKMEVAFQSGLHSWLEVICERSFIELILDDIQTRIPAKFKSDVIKSDKPLSLLTKSNNLSATLIVNQIMTCPFEGIMRQCYLESKSLELFITGLGLLLPNERENKAETCFHKRKTEEAWYILITNLEDSPSIAELACMVGLSESTLKRAFKKHYSQSIFAMFQDYRLNYAKKILECGECNITETAFSVGYSDTAHFSRAFHKYFGFCPKSYLHKKYNQF